MMISGLSGPAGGLAVIKSRSTVCSWKTVPITEAITRVSNGAPWRYEILGDQCDHRHHPGIERLLMDSLKSARRGPEQDVAGLRDLPRRQSRTAVQLDVECSTDIRARGGIHDAAGESGTVEPAVGGSVQISAAEDVRESEVAVCDLDSMFWGRRVVGD